MYDLFIEMNDKLFWDGYTEQLARENPLEFEFELNEFFNAYKL